MPPMSQLALPPNQALAVDRFAHDTYKIQRPFWTLFGRTFKVFAPDGSMAMFVKHKILTFKDEWNVFTDESETTPLLRVKARTAIGFSIITDVFDFQSGAIVGTVRNRGLKTIFRDAWDVLGPGEQVVGELIEDSNGLARRFLPTFFGMPLIPGRWHLAVNGIEGARIQEQRRFFIKEFDVHIDRTKIDPRFAIACALLALMRELQRERG
jgi:hypothetical protein